MNVYNKVVCLSLASLFRPVYNVASKVGAYLSELSYPDLARKHKNVLETLAKNKHSSLLETF
jgi:hypothetical protein